jgi:hypothetical protein
MPKLALSLSPSLANVRNWSRRCFRTLLRLQNDNKILAEISQYSDIQ